MQDEIAKASMPFQFSTQRMLAIVGLCGLGMAGIRWLAVVEQNRTPSAWQVVFGISSLLAIGGGFGGALGLLIRQPIRCIVYGTLFVFFFTMLWPALQSGSRPRRPSPIDNLHNIDEAMITYEGQYGQLPAQAIFDAKGRPLLSWRVRLLPYIEQQALYDQFHLDEPWNSPHNQALISQMPKIYATPGRDSSDHRTAYLVPTGPNTVFDADKRITSDSIAARHGTSNTILVVEVDPNRTVIWTKPEDLEVNFDHPLNGLGHAHKAGFCAIFVDGAAKFISADIAPTDLKLLFMPNSKEKPRPGSF